MKPFISLVLLFCFLFTTACSDDSEPPRRLPTEVPDNNNAQRDTSDSTTDDANNTTADATQEDVTEDVTPCVPETDLELCAANDAQCGEITATDNCGAIRTIKDCGTCAGEASCASLGTANQCECIPPSIVELCEQHNLECGEKTVVDACGTERLIDCGTAGLVCENEFDTCGGGGKANECGCEPTTCREANALCGDIPDGCGGTLSCNYFCVDDISSNDQHACAVGSGKVKCWGTNNFGQLGDNSKTKRLNPINVLDLDITTQIAAGGRHTCALLHDGGVVCWGDNTNSQLGIATTVSASKPGERAIQSGATQVVSGNSHACALVDGGVVCWGFNNYGQIGNINVEMAVNIGRPLDVTGLTSGVKSIAAGQHHNCAIKAADGSVHCWGRNRFGQLGNLNKNFSSPQIEAFSHFDDPLITLDIATREKFPVQVPGLNDVESLALGDDFSCALKTNGEVWCWGSMARAASANFKCNVIIGLKPNGELDSMPSQFCSIFPYELEPRQFTDAPIIKVNSSDKITAIYNNSAALRPVKIPVRKTTRISGGANHFCMLIDEPDSQITNIQCMGLNTDGQLGDGTTNSWPVPYSIFLDVDSNIVRARDLTLGARNSCAITGDSNVKCWGSNADGQLGNSAVPNQQSYRPFDVKIIYD